MDLGIDFNTTAGAHVETDDMDDFSSFLIESFVYISMVTLVVFVLTAFGNTLILTSLIKYRQIFKGSLYILIGNLAVTDIILGIVMLLMFLEYNAFQSFQTTWGYCIFKSVGVIAMFMCTMFTLTMISVDRFVAVMYPLKHIVLTRQKKLFFGSVCMCWLLTICGVVIGILKIDMSSDKIVCRLENVFPESSKLAATTIVFGNIVTSAILYTVIVLKIRAKPTMTSSGRRRKCTNKTNIMIIVFLFFILCWSPFLICTLIISSSSGATKTRAFNIRAYATVLGFINSGFNWILYGLFNKKFRKSFKKLLMCNCYKHILSNTNKPNNEPQAALEKDNTNKAENKTLSIR